MREILKEKPELVENGDIAEILEEKVSLVDSGRGFRLTFSMGVMSIPVGYDSSGKIELDSACLQPLSKPHL